MLGSSVILEKNPGKGRANKTADIQRKPRIILILLNSMNEDEKIFYQYFSPESLRLAWERMIRSNGKDIKDYFGIEIYDTHLEKNLGRLSDVLILGKFKPQRGH
jgi:hypothetical protein